MFMNFHDGYMPVHALDSYGSAYRDNLLEPPNGKAFQTGNVFIYSDSSSLSMLHTLTNSFLSLIATSSLK